MDELKQLVIKRLKALEIVSDASVISGVIEIATEEVVHKILNYTNQRTLPKGLYPLASKLICIVTESYIPAKTPDSGDNSDMMDGLVPTSVKVGDVTVSLAQASTSSSSGATARQEISIDELLNDYKSELNSFRKVRW